MGSMNPQQNPQNPQPGQGTSLDYLNQIAPTAAKKSLPFIGGPLKPIHYIFAGLIILLVVVLIISIAANAGGGNKRKLEQLAGRLNTTATIVEGAESRLKSTILRTLNSNLKLSLANTNRDITAPLARIGINTTKLPANVVREEAATDVTDRLEDARLNAVYDSTYAREMAYQLDTILTLMKDAYSSSNNEQVKSFLTTAYNNLEPTQEAFAEFNASTE
jgi:hypothetical protein